jgi:hypothetical protein
MSKTVFSVARFNWSAKLWYPRGTRGEIRPPVRRAGGQRGRHRAWSEEKETTHTTWGQRRARGTNRRKRCAAARFPSREPDSRARHPMGPVTSPGDGQRRARGTNRRKRCAAARFPSREPDSRARHPPHGPKPTGRCRAYHAEGLRKIRLPCGSPRSPFAAAFRSVVILRPPAAPVGGRRRWKQHIRCFRFERCGLVK